MSSLSGARCNAVSTWLGALQADKNGNCCFVAASCKSILTQTHQDLPLLTAVTVLELADAANGSSAVEMSLEEALKRERSRTTTAGITEFHWNPSQTDANTVLLPFKGDLFVAHAPDQAADFESPRHACRWRVTCAFKRADTAYGGAAAEVQWSHDGHWIFFVQDGEVCATSAAPLAADWSSLSQPLDEAAASENTAGQTSAAAAAAAHTHSAKTSNVPKAWQITNGHITLRLSHGAWESRASDAPFRHGEADYLAQESFDRFKGFWPSPCAQLLAFQRTRDSHIPPFHIRHQHSVDPYAGETHRYPFPGGAAPIVTLHCIKLDVLEAVRAAAHAEIVSAASWATLLDDLCRAAPPVTNCEPYAHTNWYVCRCDWDFAKGFLVVACNRAQNQKDLVRFALGCGAGAGACAPCTLLLRERSSYWADVCSDVWKPLIPPATVPPSSSVWSDHVSGCSTHTHLLLWGTQVSGYRHVQLLKYEADALPTDKDELNDGCCSFGATDVFPSPGAGTSSSLCRVWQESAHGAAELCSTVTHGRWNVTSIDGADAETGTLFVTGNARCPLVRTPMAVPMWNISVLAEQAPAAAMAATAPDCVHWFDESLSDWGADMAGWGTAACAYSFAPGGFCVSIARLPAGLRIGPDALIALESSSMTSPGSTRVLRFDAHKERATGTFTTQFEAKYSPRKQDTSGGGGGTLTAPGDDPLPPVSALGNPLPTLFALPVDSGRQTLLGALWLPADASAAAASAPPKAVVSVYGGPGVQYVQAHHKYTGADRNVAALLADGFAVVRVDNRGSDGRSCAFEGAIHKAMGGVEIEDQAAAVQWLQAKGAISSQRVGVTGWSYGGYAALLCALRFPLLFGTAVAGAPVTHWRLYDCGYTERYMGWPTDLVAGAEAADDVYYRSSVAAHLGTLTEKDAGGDSTRTPKLLIIHGLLDENVHFRHTARLVASLQAAGAPHELLVLPTERHGPRSPAVRTMVLRRSAAFLLQNV